MSDVIGAPETTYCKQCVRWRAMARTAVRCQSSNQGRKVFADACYWPIDLLEPDDSEEHVRYRRAEAGTLDGVWPEVQRLEHSPGKAACAARLRAAVAVFGKATVTDADSKEEFEVHKEALDVSEDWPLLHETYQEVLANLRLTCCGDPQREPQEERSPSKQPAAADGR